MSAFLFLLGLALIVGACLGYAAVKFKRQDDPLVEQINQRLPQTQCGQCSYPGCRPYAQAIAAGEAEINQCPPGGQQTVIELAQLLNREPLPLAEAEKIEEKPLVAIIDESVCIGCVLCIKACPVDAIIGAAKYMHTVIEKECTGCKLCIPVCPVNCIDMVTTEDRTMSLAQRFLAGA